MKNETIIEADTVRTLQFDQEYKWLDSHVGYIMRNGDCGLQVDDKRLYTNAPDGEYPVSSLDGTTDSVRKGTRLVEVKNGKIDGLSLLKASDEWLLGYNSPHNFLEDVCFDPESETIEMDFGS